jgi:hypothetical protein
MLNLEGMADNGDWDSQKRKVFFSSTHLVFEITKEGRTPFKIFLGLPLTSLTPNGTSIS